MMSSLWVHDEFINCVRWSDNLDNWNIYPYLPDDPVNKSLPWQVKYLLISWSWMQLRALTAPHWQLLSFPCFTHTRIKLNPLPLKSPLVSLKTHARVHNIASVSKLLILSLVKLLGLNCWVYPETLVNCGQSAGLPHRGWESLMQGSICKDKRNVCIHLVIGPL